jgi:hypothetical protein
MKAGLLATMKRIRDLGELETQISDVEKSLGNVLIIGEQQQQSVPVPGIGNTNLAVVHAMIPQPVRPFVRLFIPPSIEIRWRSCPPASHFGLRTAIQSKSPFSTYTTSAALVGLAC